MSLFHCSCFCFPCQIDLSCHRLKWRMCLSYHFQAYTQTCSRWWTQTCDPRSNAGNIPFCYLRFSVVTSVTFSLTHTPRLSLSFVVPAVFNLLSVGNVSVQVSVLNLKKLRRKLCQMPEGLQIPEWNILKQIIVWCPREKWNHNMSKDQGNASI